jgi:putative ABC transport system substrate-binding protein
VAVLVNPANAGSVPTLRQMEATARALNVTLAPYEARTPGDFDALFATMAKARVDAIVFQDDTLFGEANAGPLAALATRHRLVGAGSQAFADAGGTIGYGRLDAELYRRGAYFVDRILHGAKPGDLPIEQATRFELVINRKAAGAVGLNLPDRVLLRADRVVE